MAITRRVLFLARCLDSGGVPTHMMTLAHQLRTRGWEVALSSGAVEGVHSHGPEWFEASGVRHLPVPFPQTPREIPLRAWGAVRGLLARMREFRPDLLHAHYRATTPYAFVAGALLRVPLVVSLHANVPGGRLERALSFWGARTIAISTDLREDLVRRFHVPEERIETIYTGADADHFRPPTAVERAAARARLGVEGPRLAVAVVGRLETLKGQHVVLRAAALLRQAGAPATLLLAGVGPARPRLAKLAGELGIAEDVRFLGHVDSREVFWASEVSVLASRLEGFGLVVPESMLCGVVPIRTPGGGARDQIQDGVTGFVVPFDDPAALAARLRELTSDGARRARMADAARAFALANLDARAMGERTVAVYEAALSGSRRLEASSVRAERRARAEGRAG